MKTYIAFLRGINVGGQKKIKMEGFRTLLNSEGFHQVRTYIQSGNILFESTENADTLKQQIEGVISKNYGFDVITIIRTPDQLKKIMQENPYLDNPEKDQNRTYFTLLSQKPETHLSEELKNSHYPPEEAVLQGDVLYFYSPLGYGDAKMNNNFFEKKLKVDASTRNWKTMNKLIEMAENI